MRVLVLGGTRFVGRAVAEGLIARGFDMSILTRGRLPVEYDGLMRHYRGDRRDPASLSELAGERFDAVVDVSAYAAADVAPVLDMLRFGEGTRYVLVSSGAVYVPSDAPLAEDAPIGENEVWGAYGLGKLEAERLLARERAQLGFALTILRPAYLYGPGNNLYREAYLFGRLEQGIAVPVPAGGARTQFLHIDDFVRLLLSVLDAEPWGAEVLNCAHPEPVGWDGLVRAAAAAVGVEPRIVPVDACGAMEAREFFPFRDQTYLLDVGKAARFGLAQPRIALAEGMRSSWEWFRRERPRLADPRMSRVEEALRMDMRRIMASSGRAPADSTLS
ncbi:NAD-dependent epimerase/dehydratase family protein [Arabiibacter massiliensis]|uniref:NAD-dependent epimerase/dehydratase family protein n=1 Tax=Arabiibacter massiliensis TaxID=1870985 RepID=UPI0009BAEF91|nr:NAD-dependent epimerase/dehydratase family protein [Arabiibacter massiliensis]